MPGSGPAATVRAQALHTASANLSARTRSGGSCLRTGPLPFRARYDPGTAVEGERRGEARVPAVPRPDLTSQVETVLAIRKTGAAIVSLAPGEETFANGDDLGSWVTTLVKQNANAEKSRTVKVQTYRGISMIRDNKAHHGALPTFWETRGVRYAKQAFCTDPAAVADMYERVAGGESLASVGRAYDIYPNSVRSVIRFAANHTGVEECSYTYEGQTETWSHEVEPVVDSPLWWRANKVLAVNVTNDRANKGGRPVAWPANWLSGVLECPECGGKLYLNAGLTPQGNPRTPKLRCGGNAKKRLSCGRFKGCDAQPVIDLIASMFSADETKILAFQRVAGNAHELDALNAELRKIHARPEQAVIPRLGECQGLDEIPLGERARGGAVIAHPRGQQRSLTDCGEQFTPHGFGVAAAEHPVRVSSEVLDERLPRVPSAIAVIELGEHVNGYPEPFHVGRSDARAARRPVARHLVRVHKPAQRGVIPRSRVGPAALDQRGVVEVGNPQPRDVPPGLLRIAGIGQVRIGPRCGHGNGPRTGIKPQCTPRGGRQANAVGELLERRNAFGFALARSPLTESSLGNAGQLGNAALSEAARHECGSDRAEITPGASVHHFRTRADGHHD